MIVITMSNGHKVRWSEKEYDDYKYDGKCFILIKNGEYIGFYNLEYVISIVVGKADEEK